MLAAPPMRGGPTRMVDPIQGFTPGTRPMGPAGPVRMFKKGGKVEDPVAPAFTFGYMPNYVPYLGNYLNYGETGPEHMFFGPGTPATGGGNDTLPPDVPPVDTDGDGIPDDVDTTPDGKGDRGIGHDFGNDPKGFGGGGFTNARDAEQVARGTAPMTLGNALKLGGMLAGIGSMTGPLLAAKAALGMNTGYEGFTPVDSDLVQAVADGRLSRGAALAEAQRRADAARASQVNLGNAFAGNAMGSGGQFGGGGGLGGYGGGATGGRGPSGAAPGGFGGGFSGGPGIYAKGGPVDGGQADNVPAMLSKGEYVIPSDVVADLGDGSSDAGYRRLSELVRRVRSHKGRGNRLPPPAKGLSAYMGSA